VWDFLLSDVMNPWSSFGSRLLQTAARRCVRKKKYLLSEACSDFMWSSSCRFHSTTAQEELRRVSLNVAAAATRRRAAFPLAAASKWIAEEEVGGEFSQRLLTRTRMFCTGTQLMDSRELRLSRGRRKLVAPVEAQADTHLSEDEEEEDEEEGFEEDEDDGNVEVEVRRNKRVGSSSRRSRLYSMSKPRLLAPVRDLIAEAVERGYAKKNAIGLARATSQPKYSAAEDRVIVNHFSYIIRSIVDYYAFVNKRSSLWKVTSIYRKSCALTLARKHSMRSAAAAFKRFGPYLRISEHGKEVTSLYYPTSLKTTGKFNIRDPRYCEVSILKQAFERSKREWR
jgi:hypothetical protein